MTDTITRTAGIDTAKHKLDVALTGLSRRWQLPNCRAGFIELAALLRRQRVTRIGIEASGGYERAVVEHLRKAGFTVLLLQPRQVKAYARFTLKRAKSDPIDAGLIAACTQAVEQTPEPPDPRLAPIAETLTVLEQTEQDIARLKVRGEHLSEAALKRILQDDIKRLAKRRAALIEAITRKLRQYPDLARRLQLVETIPGLGRRTAMALVVRMPELGRLTRQAIASLAGLAPFDNDSGQRRGARHIAGGRARPRKSLYAAALPAAMRWNPQLVAIYKRLTANGKPHKVALIACARKLLIYANAVLQRGTPWRDKPAPI
jgi:transposase